MTSRRSARGVRHGVALLVALAAGVPGAGPAAAGATPEPPVERACDLAESLARATPGTSLERHDGVFDHEGLHEPLRGCRLAIAGSFAATPPGDDAIRRLRDGFAARGWRELLAHAADGVDGSAFALRSEAVACWFQASWDGGSDDAPAKPRGPAYAISVLCTDDLPPE